MSNKDLLKQAIAEAKTIREAAIANAKEALEESLTPHLKDMLAAKLQEMEEAEDEEVVNEEGAMQDEESNTYENISEEEEEAKEVEGEEEEGEEEEGEEEAEVEGEDEDLNIEDMTVEDLKGLIQSIVAQEIGHDESQEEIPGEEAPEGADDMQGMDSEEEIDINELLAELDAMDEEETLEEEELDEVDLAAKLRYTNDYGKRQYTDSSAMSESKEELEEALATIEVLRSQLQEVNLLNAKLLYVNKVFKSNNLTESQKVNVIAAFDKAETVREVKLVFETVSKNVVTKPATIKEHKSFASKATGTSTKEVLPQVNEQVARWQKLAGIIK